MADIIFMDKRHEDLFYSYFKAMKTHDCYHGSAAYLLALDEVIRDHTKSVFDFKEDIIKPECISEPWQTGTSKKTTRLLFNLWNGKYKDSIPERFYDDEAEEEAEKQAAYSSQYYAVDNIFCCSYAPYYMQAVKLRYPKYF